MGGGNDFDVIYIPLTNHISGIKIIFLILSLFFFTYSGLLSRRGGVGLPTLVGPLAIIMHLYSRS